MVTGRGSVEVSVESIIEAWEAQGNEDVWLRLHCSKEIHDAVTTAADRADEVAVEHDTQTMSITPCPGGFAVEVGPVFFEPGLDVWVRSFVDSLESDGVSGRLSAVEGVWSSDLLEARRRPTVGLFAWWDHDAFVPDRQLGRAPTDGIRRLVEETVTWALRDPGRITLWQDGLSLRVGPEALAHNLARVRSGGRGASVEVVDEAAGRARHASFGPREGLFQVVGGEGDPVDELRALAVRLAPLVTLAFVRMTRRGALGVTYLDAVQPLPGTEEHHMRYAPQLMERYVPDAHGVQVVGPAHLEAAHDLSRWTVTDLGNDRHLVEAPDQDPWYGSVLPSPEALTQGRSDWAGAILTVEASTAAVHGPA